jgi:hypothetical protein
MKTVVLLLLYLVGGICAWASTTSPAAGSVSDAEPDFSSAVPIHFPLLTPLQQRIHDLEWQMQNYGRPEPLDEATFQQVKLEVAELYAQLPRDRAALDDGSDACPATTIPVNIIPWTDYGTTFGAVNNFNPISPCGPTYAPDKIYRYVPNYTATYSFDTFGSTYDTQIYVNTGGACPGTTQVACNDDMYGSQSQVLLTMNAGQEYFIIVDGFQGYSGNFVLHLTNTCLLGNSSSWQQECVENPADPAFAMFDCDGGCSNGLYGGIEQWQTLNFCQLLHGNAFTYTGPDNFSKRDTDHYTFTLSEPCSVKVSYLSVFTSNIVLSYHGACPENNLFSLINIPACMTVAPVTPCLPAGTYTLSIMPSFFAGMTDPHSYLSLVEAFPCSGCKVDNYFSAPISFSSGTCYGNDNSLRPSQEVTYCVVIPHASDWTFSLCSSSPSWDSYMYLTRACNGQIVAQDDNGCGDGLSKIECLPLQAGNYYLTIEGKNPGDCGQFYLDVSECVGSCCYGDYWNPSCSYGARSQCDALGGTFTQGQSCVPGLCYPRPDCSVPDVEYSQRPHVPDEAWSALASDNYLPNRVYEDYSVTGIISSLTFWGVSLDYNTGLACTELPGSFRITFVDSSAGPAVQTFNVTATGILLPQNYGANYPMYEYTVQLPTPCTLLNGRVSIVGFDNDPCVFHWATSPQGNGNVVLINSGGPVFIPRDVAVCFGRGCPAPDSVVIRPAAANAYDIAFHLPAASYVRVYASANVNAAFPATYTVIAAGSLSAGNWIWTDSSADPQRRYVLTAQCGPPPILLNESSAAFRPRR